MINPIIDTDHLNQQTFDDPDLKHEILLMFKEQSIVLLAALDAQSGQARSDTAHRLKGSALAIGATQLAEAADALERMPTDSAALHTLHLLCDKTQQAVVQLLQE